MNRHAWLIVLTVLCLPANAEAHPRITVTLGAEHIYEGQAVLYRVGLHDMPDDAEPELGKLDHMDVIRPATRMPRANQRNADETLERVRQYDYQLLLHHAGTLTIPGPAVTAGSQTLHGEAKTLQVVPAPAQQLVTARVTSDRTTVYPMQTFTVALTVTVKGLPTESDGESTPHDVAAQPSPLSIQRERPVLRIPWADDARLPKELLPQMRQEQWLGTLRPGFGPGFNINDLRHPSLIATRVGERMSFSGKVTARQERDDHGKAIPVWQYEYPRRFTALQPGTYGFGPAAVQGVFGTRMADHKLFGEEIYAVAPRIEVVVRDIPEEGRPATFTGAIGRFKLMAQAEPRRLRIGDPLTLTLTLEGEGTLDATRAPELTGAEDLTALFQVHAPTVENNGDRRLFTYSLRPIQAGSLSVPPVVVSYFDVASERYETLHTEPIPIDVVAAEPLSSDQIVAASRTPETADEQASPSNRHEANAMRPPAWRGTLLRWTYRVLALGCFVALGVGIVLVTGRLRRVFNEREKTRQRQAVARARHEFQSALATLAADEIRQGARAIQLAVIGLVADTSSLAATALTSREIREHLQSRRLPLEIVDQVSELLTHCDAVCYGDVTLAPDDLAREAQRTFDSLVDHLNARC